MKLKPTLAVIFCIFFFSATVAQATYVYENKDGEYATDVDKFIPQSGVKVKTSRLADMMENGTRNAMEGHQEPRNVQNRNPQNQQRNGNRQGPRSYRWWF